MNTVPASQRPQFVIVGAGQAGGWAAKTLRDEGFQGRIVLIGSEPHPPYERPPLSKALLTARSEPTLSYLWPQEKIAGLNIELERSSAVVEVNRRAHDVTLACGRRIQYDRLLLATGARPRRLTLPGANLKGIHYLRTIEESLAIRSAFAESSRVLVVGGGWIGLEVAAAAVIAGRPVTLIESAAQLCGRSLPAQAAALFQELHTARGVEVRLNARLIGFDGAATVERALLADGTVVSASCVVVGIGVEPNIELALDCGLEVDNGIVVDEQAYTSDPDIFACGDVANQPFGPETKRIRFESWQNAQNHGIAAAKAMMGSGSTRAELPWFWSDQYDINFQMFGIPTAGDDLYVKGDSTTGKLLMYFVRDRRLNAAAGFNVARELREAKRLLSSGKSFDETGLRRVA